jgi:predicted metal-dependent phosphoesterase TrpH
MASQPVQGIKVPAGFYVFRGLEISTDRGHLLVYGLKDDSWNIWSRNNYLDVFKVLEKVHALGGICVPAHPFREWDSFGENVMKFDTFDALETHNGLNRESENQRAIQVARKKNLPSIGGSDCHNRAQVGAAFTVFENSAHTMDELVQEIKKGNCRGMKLDG